MARRERLQYYRLIGKLPVPCANHLEWAMWFETARAERIVRQDQIGPLRVSTVFLGIDHQFDDDPNMPSRLFETMIFDGGEDAYQTRCATWDEAERQHEEGLAEARRRYERALAMLPALEKGTKQ